MIERILFIFIVENMIFVCVCIFTLVVFAALTFASRNVNSLISSGNFVIKSDDSAKVKPYKFDLKLYVVFAVIALISGFIGYRTYCHYFDQSHAMSICILGILRELICLVALLMSASYDYKLRIIPNYIPFALIVLRVIYFCIEFFVMDDYKSTALSSLIGLLGAFLIITIVNKISREGIGAGDMKLLSALGFFAGASFVVKLSILSLISCFFIAIFLMMFKKFTVKDTLPFGPFILIGFMLGAIIGVI